MNHLKWLGVVLIGIGTALTILTIVLFTKPVGVDGRCGSVYRPPEAAYSPPPLDNRCGGPVRSADRTVMVVGLSAAIPLLFGCGLAWAARFRDVTVAVVAGLIAAGWVKFVSAPDVWSYAESLVWGLVVASVIGVAVTARCVIDQVRQRPRVTT